MISFAVFNVMFSVRIDGFKALSHYLKKGYLNCVGVTTQIIHALILYKRFEGIEMLERNNTDTLFVFPFDFS